MSPADDRSNSTAAFMVYACAPGAVDIRMVFRPRFDAWEATCRFSTPPLEDLAVAGVLVVATRGAESRGGGVEKPGCLGMCLGGGTCVPVGFRDMETIAGSTNSEVAGVGVGVELTMVAV